MLNNNNSYVSEEKYGFLEYNYDKCFKSKIKGEIIEFDFDKMYSDYGLNNIL